MNEGIKLVAAGSLVWLEPLLAMLEARLMARHRQALRWVWLVEYQRALHSLAALEVRTVASAAQVRELEYQAEAQGYLT
jgi:hypothetical protein